MIIHCSHKLAAKLPRVSREPLVEASVLGSWHAHLFVLDRRQCVLFCHDVTRFMLFQPGWRKEDFGAMDYWFRDLFANTLLKMNYPSPLLEKGVSLLTAPQFDIATDRSVQGSMRVTMMDIEWWTIEAPTVMDLPFHTLSARLNQRPVSIKGSKKGLKADATLWPDRAMRQFIEQTVPKARLRLVR